MKKISIKTSGKLVLESAPIPSIKPGEMLIQVKACGVNRLDLLMAKKQMPIQLPHTPGCEVSGIITEINGDSVLKKGQEVVVNAAIPCGKCARCKKKLSCEKVTIFGYGIPGGFAEYTVVPIDQVYLKPENLPFVEAASFPLIFLTAWHMLSGRANLQPGEKVLIWGASGGLGSAGIQVAKYFGAQVIAVVGLEDDVEKVKKLGADHVIVYTKHNVLEKVNTITEGEKVEVVFENVGEKTWNTNLQALQPYGRLVIAGATSGTDVTLNLRELYRYQHTLLGASMGTKEEFEKVLQLFSEGKLHPVVDSIFPLEQASDALRRMEESKQFGKIVLAI